MAQNDENKKEETGFASGLVTFLLFGMGVAFGMDAGAIAAHIADSLWWSLPVAVFLFFVVYLFVKLLGNNIWMIFVLGLPFGALLIVFSPVHKDFVNSGFYADTGGRVVQWLSSFQTAKLTVRSDVYNDILYINGKDYGPTGPESHTLKSGEHRIRVEKDGHKTWTKTVDLEPNEEVKVIARLPASAGDKSGNSGKSVGVSESSESISSIDLSRPIPNDALPDGAAQCFVVGYLKVDAGASHTSRLLRGREEVIYTNADGYLALDSDCPGIEHEGSDAMWGPTDEAVKKFMSAKLPYLREHATGGGHQYRVCSCDTGGQKYDVTPAEARSTIEDHFDEYGQRWREEFGFREIKLDGFDLPFERGTLGRADQSR